MIGKYKVITLCGSTRFKDGQPVSTKQIRWVVKNFPDTLTYSAGRVFLMI